MRLRPKHGVREHTTTRQISPDTSLLVTTRRLEEKFVLEMTKEEAELVYVAIVETLDFELATSLLEGSFWRYNLHEPHTFDSKQLQEKHGLDWVRFPEEESVGDYLDMYKLSKKGSK